MNRNPGLEVLSSHKMDCISKFQSIFFDGFSSYKTKKHGEIHLFILLIDYLLPPWLVYICNIVMVESPKMLCLM